MLNRCSCYLQKRDYKDQLVNYLDALIKYLALLWVYLSYQGLKPYLKIQEQVWKKQIKKKKQKYQNPQKIKVLSIVDFYNIFLNFYPILKTVYLPSFLIRVAKADDGVGVIRILTLPDLDILFYVKHQVYYSTLNVYFLLPLPLNIFLKIHYSV